MKKFCVIFLVVLILAFPVFANGEVEQTSEAKGEMETEKVVVWGPNTFGENVKYDPDVVINDGKPITLDYWIWTDDALFTSIMEDYSAVHPNVTINVISNPYTDYWTKLPLMLKGDNGPALFNIHNAFEANFMNYAAPYDIDIDEIKADFDRVEAHEKNGKVNYIDLGLMTSSVFYNKDLWTAAGLTDDDIPTTWDEFREVAKKLTIWDGDKLVQAGLNINGCVATDIIMGLNYQKGQTLFSEDGKSCVLNNEVEKENLQMAYDWYKVDKVGSEDFGDNGFDSFGQGLSAMTLGWGWRGRYIEYFFPEMNFDVFQIPTFDNNPVGYDRVNAEACFGVNKNASPEQQAVAQDIVRFYLANDTLQKRFNTYMNTYPTKKSIQNDPDILSVKACNVLAQNADQYVYPGAMPQTVEDNCNICAQNIFYNGMSIEKALKICEDAINDDLLGTDFVAVENQFVNSDKFTY